MAAVVLKAPERFAFDCEVLPAGDVPPLKLELQGKYRTRDELEAFLTKAAAQTDVEIVADELLAWNVQLEDGTPVACDASGIAALLNIYPNAGPALHEAYVRTLIEARRKN